MYGTILSDSVNEQKIFSSRKRSRQTYRNKILRAYSAVRENYIYEIPHLERAKWNAIPEDLIFTVLG